MTKVTKRMIGKREVTIIEEFPDDIEDMNYIKKQINDFTVRQLQKQYTNAELDILIPIYNRALELKLSGMTFEQGEKIAKQEYIDKTSKGA